MQASEVQRATAATLSIANALGLRADHAIVVHNSNKLALRLTPCDVFARVAHLSHQVARFEVEIANRLAEAGSPAAALETRVPPIVQERDGFAVTFWTWRPSLATEVTTADYASALAQLHTGLRGIRIAAPHFTDRVAEAEQLVADRSRTPGLADADRALLGGMLPNFRQSIVGRGAAEQLLHGEPHPGNLLNTEAGPLFIDLETCCRGPVEFDLAHAPEAVAAHYSGVDQVLLGECRGLVLAMVAAWRWDTHDEFPNGRQWAQVLMRTLSKSAPWPSLDALGQRLYRR